MNTFLRLFMLFLMAGTFTLCAPPKNQEEQEEQVENGDVPVEERAKKALYDEVMEIHDAIMPRMDDIMKLKGDLREQLDQLKEATDAVAAEKSKAMEEIVQQLEDADEGMMNWMRNFRPLEDSTAYEEAIQYLEEQKKGIEEVKVKMEEAMEAAKNALEGEE